MGKLTDEEKIGMSPAEIEALEGSNADALLAMHGAGQQDGDGGTTNAAPAPGPAAEGAAAAPAGDGPVDEGGTDDDDGGETQLTPEQLAEALAETEAPAVAPAPKPLKVEDTDFTAERKKLTDEKAKVERRWSAGEEGCTDEWRIQELQRIDDLRDDLLRRQTRAETIRDQNEQAAAQHRETYDAQIGAATTALLAASQKEGSPVNYKTDAKAQVQFDNALTMVEADPDAATLTPAQRVAEAHRLVLARRGIVQQTAAPTPAPAAPTPPAPAARRDVPVTLSGLPNAGRDGAQNDILAELSQLSGEEYEMKLASLPAGTVERLLRQADNAAAAAAA